MQLELLLFCLRSLEIGAKMYDVRDVIVESSMILEISIRSRKEIIFITL